MPVKRKTKRKRGGQKGNQNARKHGFYSTSLSLQQICEFWNAVNLGGVDPEIVALRIKLDSALRYAPGNRRLLREAARLLAKWYRSKYRLAGTDNAAFKKAVRSILEPIGNETMRLAGTNRS